MCSKSDSASSLHLLSVIVESVRDNSLGAIFVGCGGGGGELVDGIVEVFVVGPVLAALGSLELSYYVQRREFTLLLWTFCQYLCCGVFRGVFPDVHVLKIYSKWVNHH